MSQKPAISKSWAEEDYPIKKWLLEQNSLVKLLREESRPLEEPVS